VNAAASILLSNKTLQYSFDGGISWQAGASREFAPGVTLAAGSMQVKDSIGNIVKYNSPVSIPAFSGRENGIDVSVHQGFINWKSVADSGVEFAIIRSLCWNRSTNSYGIDPYFEYNVRNAKANGIKVGTYLYSYAFSVSEMAQEISYFIKSAEVQRLLSEGVLFDLPVFIDYEDPLITQNTTHLTIGQRTDIVRQGMVMIEQMSGYKFLPGFYTYYNFAKTAIDGAQLQREGYDFWMARYGAAAHGWSPSPALWQYSSTGTVPGIGTNVDLNYNYTDFSGINGGNVPPPVTSHNLTVTNQYGQVITGQAASILAQIVENEVGGFNNAEVYKAQAIAAHSWIMYQQSQGYQAPQVGLKSPRAAVQTAVNQVVTEILVYDGAAAFAPYYAYSNGTTNNSQYWGSNLSYLQSVTSSWDREKTAYAGSISRGDLKGRIEAVYGAGATNGYAETDWINITSVNAAGYVTGVSVCGYKPTVDFFYQTLIRYDNGNGGLTYPIGSPSFTISYNGSGLWNFTTSGYGHGVGMSQYGASRMAAGGSTYKQILAHYYPGTTVSSI
jgi:SpoIID/LytB domain protein